MNTERERFQEWLYSQKPAPWKRFDTADEVGFFVWQHQAATIADLQQQLTEANRQNKELREYAIGYIEGCIEHNSYDTLPSLIADLQGREGV
jgi:hypothetical protein